MDDRSLQSIKQHLQSKDAQVRILKNIERGRSEATVTIGRAANLFNFTENQLRDWEARGLVSPNKSSGGQRLYPLTELDRLAIIRELLDAKYSPGDIPENLDALWNAIAPANGGLAAARQGEGGRVEEDQIDKRVEQAESDNFWRYFVSQVMRLSLLLICEDMPDTITGMILPLRKLENREITDPAEVFRAGPSMVGWLPQNRAFYSFLTSRPSFEYPSDFRVEQFNLSGIEAASLTPLIITQRRARSLLLTSTLVQTIQRLLTVVYHHIDEWRPCFDYGKRDFVYHVADFSTGLNLTDRTLDGLMDMIVDLGGKTVDGRDRWRFSALFLPQDDSLPIQQRTLDVRAQSQQTPARWDTVVISNSYSGLSFRAYQSGHVIYRPDISENDHIFANREYEQTTRSAIAIPIAGENGMAVAVAYIASDEVDAFSQTDRRVLRVMTRMIEELLPTYRARQQVPGKLSDLLYSPRVIDLAFRDFLSEDDFIDDLEQFLTTIQSRQDIEPKNHPDLDTDPSLWSTTNKTVSFIEVDIDKQAELATKYGDQVARNLSKAVGQRIQGQLRIQSSPDYRKVYHVNADKYFMKFIGMPLEDAQELAQAMHKQLSGIYRIDARRVVPGRPLLRENLLELPNVMVRLGVQSYPFAKLKELLLRPAVDVTELRATIMTNLDQSLNLGQVAGGNCIFTWDPEIWGYRRLLPDESSA